MNQELGAITLESLEVLKKRIQTELKNVSTSEEAEAFRIKYVGRKGLLSEATKQLKTVTPEDRPQVGQFLNVLKRQVESDLEGKSFVGKKTVEGGVDRTLPGRIRRKGGLHVLTSTMDDVKSILRGLNFEIVDGPEWETEHYNFDALNTPPDHPARDMQASFYMEGGGVLRTHTSPVQIRAMETRKPPLRIASVGKCFRADMLDASHSPAFHQVEGLMVGHDVSMAHLRGVLRLFFESLFDQSVELRFLPSFFPFVEPGAEVSVRCVLCQRQGCAVCKQTTWLELGGAGMVHPRVFRAMGYDEEQWTGFAFGFGIERFAMIRHGIDDLRLFYENDVRFLGQFT